MDFETFFQSLFAIIKSGDNLYYVLYALATCLLTQVAKKLFVNKVKVDILHKFDVATILPFVFGFVFALVDVIWVRHTAFSVKFVTDTVMFTATIGALASLIFKFVSSLSGQSLKSLMKNDVFGVFYTQLLYFGNVREQLLNKEISLKDFISQVKLVSSNAVTIYKDDCAEEIKKDKLFRLLEGVVNRESIVACGEILHNAMMAVTKDK